MPKDPPDGNVVWPEDRTAEDPRHFSQFVGQQAPGYAVRAQKVQDIVDCGRHGRGGVKVATKDLPHGRADHWLEPIPSLAQPDAEDLGQCADGEVRRGKIAESNGIKGVRRGSDTAILRKACKRSAGIRISGLIGDLADVRLCDLAFSVGPEHVRQEAAE